MRPGFQGRLDGSLDGSLVQLVPASTRRAESDSSSGVRSDTGLVQLEDGVLDTTEMPWRRCVVYVTGERGMVVDFIAILYDAVR